MFGEVLFRHGDYYGPMVNLAARLVDAAIPGEALVDRSAWSRRSRTRRPGLRVRRPPHGEGLRRPRRGVELARLTADPLTVPTGRFAPSPTGPLHVGNLRTAVLAWLFARSAGSPFLLRIEDLDRVASREEHVRSHLDDLAALGLDWDGAVVRQSERFDRYEAALASLDADGLLYPCYCTRREVQEAVAAPHGPLPEGAYPGTCRDLTPAERAAREAEGRRPAWRVRAGGERVAVDDRLHGRGRGRDRRLRRPPGRRRPRLPGGGRGRRRRPGRRRGRAGRRPARHDAPAGVAGPARSGCRVPAYAHVPLVLGPDGERLAKRHGAVTLADLRGAGVDPPARARRDGGVARAGAAGSAGGARRLGGRPARRVRPGPPSRATPGCFDPTTHAVNM